MAKRGNSKGYDNHSLTADEKVKVQNMADTFPEHTKENLKIILQYYDYDQDKATHAITTDGGMAAINEYSKQNIENNQIKATNKRKNKNKKKNKKDTSAASVIDADDSSSLHSSNIDFDGEKESSVKLDDAYDSVDKVIQDNQSMCNNEIEISCDHQTVVDESESNITDHGDTPDEEEKFNGISPPLDIDSVENSITESERLSPKDDTDEQSRQLPKQGGRQRHGSSRHSKSSSISEEHFSQSSNSVKNRNYDRNRRDLNRQSVALVNIQAKVENKLEEASKSLKNAFTEVRNMLDKRQEELETELSKAKNDATTLLKSRQDLAADLKVRVDRAYTAPDSEWFELKADIKQFVTERKYDEQLGKTTWFCWSMDTITEEIRKFGEVAPVKNTYSQSSHQSDLNENELESKSSHLLLKDNSMGDIGQENKETKTEKEVSPKANQGETNQKPNYRVFCNSSIMQHNNNYRGHNSNRSRGYHGGGGGYPRNNRYDNNYQFRPYRGGGGNYGYNRQQQQQYSQGPSSYMDKSMEGENNNAPRFQSNRNNPRHSRRPGYTYGHKGQRPSYGQNRFTKSPRLNSEDPPAESETAAGKPTVNGFNEGSC